MFDQFKEPKHEIVTVKEEASQVQASSAISDIFRRLALGSFKKKLIIRIEGDEK
jgi:hypothetical protein